MVGRAAAYRTISRPAAKNRTPPSNAIPRPVNRFHAPGSALARQHTKTPATAMTPPRTRRAQPPTANMPTRLASASSASAVKLVGAASAVSRPVPPTPPVPRPGTWVGGGTSGTQLTFVAPQSAAAAPSRSTAIIHSGRLLIGRRTHGSRGGDRRQHRARLVDALVVLG